MSEGSGTFVRIDQPLSLKNGYIISFGDSHMVISIQKGNDLEIKFIEGPKIDQQL